MTVMLRYFTRRASYDEIAATLGVPVGTVRSRLNQAKSRLADALMQTASAAHLDHDRLADRRRQEWDAIAHEVYTTGSAALYVGRLRARRAGPGAAPWTTASAARTTTPQRRGHRRRRRPTQPDRRRRQPRGHDLRGHIHEPTRRPPPLPRDPHRGAHPPRRANDAARPLLPGTDHAHGDRARLNPAARARRLSLVIHAKASGSVPPSNRSGRQPGAHSKTPAHRQRSCLGAPVRPSARC